MPADDHRGTIGPDLRPPDTGRSPALLSVQSVSKRFRRKPVLEQVSLDVHPGEIVALIGENGAGKSTLLKICAGLLPPDSGQVHVRGRLGYCPQTPGLMDLLTADEHLILFGNAP